MLKLHPEFLKKNGTTQFVVLPYEEFVKIQEALDDANDLRALREAKRLDTGGPGMSLAEMRRRLDAKVARAATRAKSGKAVRLAR